jgi:hypothetical protein
MAISQLVSILIDVFSKIVFDINWYLCLTWFVNVQFQLVSNLQIILQLVSFQFSNWYLFQKPSWKLRGEFHSGGSFYLVKGKAFEIGGEISNLKNASCNIIPIPLTICKKDFEKIFQKDLQKQNKWCKCGPKC